MKILAALLIGLYCIAPSMADAHAGGCSKKSLPGQCCHGGKQIFHCH